MAHRDIGRQSAPGQFPTPSDDTILELLVRDHAAACVRFDAAHKANEARPNGTPQSAEYQDASFAADALAGAIAAMPATTIEGVRAKATTFQRYRRAPLGVGDLATLDDVESRLVTSIISDLLELE